MVSYFQLLFLAIWLLQMTTADNLLTQFLEGSLPSPCDTLSRDRIAICQRFLKEGSLCVLAEETCVEVHHCTHTLMKCLMSVAESANNCPKMLSLQQATFAQSVGATYTGSRLQGACFSLTSFLEERKGGKVSNCSDSAPLTTCTLAPRSEPWSAVEHLLQLPTPASSMSSSEAHSEAELVVFTTLTFKNESINGAGISFLLSLVARSASIAYDSIEVHQIEYYSNPSLVEIKFSLEPATVLSIDSTKFLPFFTLVAQETGTAPRSQLGSTPDPKLLIRPVIRMNSSRSVASPSHDSESFPTWALAILIGIIVCCLMGIGFSVWRLLGRKRTNSLSEHDRSPAQQDHGMGEELQQRVASVRPHPMSAINCRSGSVITFGKELAVTRSNSASSTIYHPSFPPAESKHEVHRQPPDTDSKVRSTPVGISNGATSLVQRAYLKGMVTGDERGISIEQIELEDDNSISNSEFQH